MLKSLCILAFGTTLLILPVLASAAEPVPGDACSTLNHVVESGGPETTGVKRILRCNGSTWQQEMTIDATGKVGIATDSPAAKLHVGGEAILGYTGLTCNSAASGAMRYNSASGGAMEFCDGTNWKSIAAAVPAACTGPNAFSFTNVSSASLGVMVTSNTITPTGCAAAMSVSVSGGGNPEISINGGPWATSGAIQAGQTIAVRLQSSATVSTARNAVVVIGSTTGTTWSVTTRAGSLKIFQTGQLYSGSGIGSLSNADALCQSRAATLGYAGTYKAVISDDTTNAKDRLTLTYPIVRATDGTTVVASTNLWAGSLDNSVDPANNGVWTGTKPDGTKTTGENCSNWTSSGANGRFGMSGVTWGGSGGAYDGAFYSGYYGAPVPCTNVWALYCIQQ